MMGRLSRRRYRLSEFDLSTFPSDAVIVSSHMEIVSYTDNGTRYVQRIPIEVDVQGKRFLTKTQAAKLLKKAFGQDVVITDF